MALNKNVNIKINLKDKAISGLKNNSSAVNQIKTGVKATAVAFTAMAVAATAALTKILKDTIDYTVAIDKLVKTTDASAESLQRLAYAAEQEHASMESLEKGLQRLSRTIKDASYGLETYTRAFDELGISIKDNDGNLRSSTDIMIEVSDIFATMTSDTEKTALAMQLFGRSGAELVPFLSQGSEAIKALGDEAETLGVVLDGSAIKQGKIFADTMTRFQNLVKGLTVQIGSALIPAVESIVDGFVSWATSGNNLENTIITILAVMDSLGKSFELIKLSGLIVWSSLEIGFLEATVSMDKAFLDLIEKLMTGLSFIAKGIDLVFGTGFSKEIEYARDQMQAFEDAEKEILDEKYALMGKYVQQWNEVLNTGGNLVNNYIEMKNKVNEVSESTLGMGEAISNVSDNVEDLTASLDESAESFVNIADEGNSMIDSMTNSISSNLTNAITDFVTTGEMDFKSFFSNILSSFTRMITEMMVKIAMAKVAMMFLSGGTGGLASGFGSTLLSGASIGSMSGGVSEMPFGGVTNVTVISPINNDSFWRSRVKEYVANDVNMTINTNRVISI